MSQKVEWNKIGRPELDKAWAEIEGSIRNTPDWHTLKESFRDEFLVFVTGNARRDYWRNFELRGCNYYGVGVSWDSHFIMKRTVATGVNAKADPLVFEFPDNTDWKDVGHIFEEEERHHIEGEVYGVPLRRLAFIDGQEGNGDGMNRVERWVTLRSAIQDERSVRCFMYLVDTEFFLENWSYGANLSNCNMITYQAFTPDRATQKAYYAPKQVMYPDRAWPRNFRS